MSVLTAFRSLLTQSSSTVLLTRQGNPVTSAVKVPRWRVESEGDREVMRATLQFGPFPAETEFDGAILNMAGTAEPVKFPSMVRLSAGMSFAYDVEMRFTKDAA